MENLQLRSLLKMKGIPFWKICDVIGISEPTMTRWMRTPLTKDRYEKIFSAIQQIEGGETHEQNNENE